MLAAPSQADVFKVPFQPARGKLWRETEKQLYVLTGLKPTYSDKALHGATTTAYLRFR